MVRSLFFTSRVQASRAKRRLERRTGVKHSIVSNGSGTFMVTPFRGR